MTEQGLRSALDRLHEAAQVARAMLLTGHPLDVHQEPLNGYLFQQRDEVLAEPEEPTDPSHECEVRAAEHDAVYFVALTLGLLLADQV